MTEDEYKSALKSSIIAVVVGAVALYPFIILAIIFDIH